MVLVCTIIGAEVPGDIGAAASGEKVIDRAAKVD